jgi:hypothetical protein
VKRSDFAPLFAENIDRQELERIKLEYIGVLLGNVGQEVVVNVIIISHSN